MADSRPAEQVRLSRLMDNRSSEGGYDAEKLESEIQAILEAEPELDLDEYGLTEDWLESFEKHVDDIGEFERPTLVPDDEVFNKTSEKNGNWLYVEYYEDDETFQQALELVGDNFVSHSKHEINPVWFLSVLQKNAKS